MASYQPIVPPSIPATCTLESGNPSPTVTQHSSNTLYSRNEDSAETNSEEFIGYLEVFVHHAREIQNICIYHKQDVYAKFHLTSNPDATVSTKIINGGGRNPVFNDKLRLDVRTIDSLLKCEVYMMSRVKNYLGDQLLGVTCVPLSKIVMTDRFLEQEFSLSATDLYHSPSGFIQLSLSYFGSAPEVLVVPSPVSSVSPEPELEDEEAIPSKYEKIEFPDLNIVEENHQMVSKFFGIPCPNLNSKASESLITSENGEEPDDEAGVRVVKNFTQETTFDSRKDAPTSVVKRFTRENTFDLRKETPTSSVSTHEPSFVLPIVSNSVSDQSSFAPTSPSKKDKKPDTGESEADSSEKLVHSTLMAPLIKFNLEPEQTMKQEDIVDMYMKSMQQFTESLAKMKLPLDIETNGTKTENATAASTQKVDASKGNGSRVFYGSRAFF